MKNESSPIVPTPVLFEQAYAIVLDQLLEMPDFLSRSMAGLATELLRRKPDGDSMSLIVHLCHVHDCDPDLYGLRIRRILSHEVPDLALVDVDVWPKERSYAAQDFDAVLARFASVKSALVDELRGLDQMALSRVGRRADGSAITVLQLIGQIAAHDWDHKRRIAGVLREFAGRAARGPKHDSNS